MQVSCNSNSRRDPLEKWSPCHQVLYVHYGFHACLSTSTGYIDVLHKSGSKRFIKVLSRHSFLSIILNQVLFLVTWSVIQQLRSFHCKIKIKGIVNNWKRHTTIITLLTTEEPLWEYSSTYSGIRKRAEYMVTSIKGSNTKGVLLSC